MKNMFLEYNSLPESSISIIRDTLDDKLVDTRVFKKRLNNRNYLTRVEQIG